MSALASFDLLSTATKPGKHAWIGQYAPLDWVGLNLNHGTNYRASSVHHQRYDVVWYFEDWFHEGDLHRMELLLDEIVRLVKDDGLLVLRYQHQLVPALKRFLTRRPGCTVEVDQEWDRRSELVTAFRIRRHGLERYRDPSWTFAVLTSGKKEEQVLKFIRSIRDKPQGEAQEIIICGPRAASYDAHKVTYLDKTYRADLAEISKKKNDIAEMASHPNLLVCHDRYALNPDFFDGFERFGYDFDFVTIRQWLDTGEEFPSYCALRRGDLVISGTRMLHRYDALYPGHFVNGGLFAIKTHTFRELPLNPIIFWEQAEDVEFTQILRDHSLPPRMNVFSSSETYLEGPRGELTRRTYRIGLPPLPDEQVDVPHNSPEPAPPEIQLSTTVRRVFNSTEAVLRPFLGEARASRIVASLQRRKKMTAALALLLMFHMLTLMLVLLIAIRVFL